MYSYLLTVIALRSSDQQIISSLLNLQDNNVDVFLAGNKSLTISTRKALLKRGSVAVAANLALSAVGDEQVRQILKDRRKDVRAKALSNALHTASDDLVTEVIPTLSRQDADRVITLLSPAHARSGAGINSLISKELLREIAAKASPQYEFALLPDAHLYSDEDLLLALGRPQLASIYPDFTELVDSRPVVVPALLKMTKSKDKSPLTKLVLSTLATCRHIFDQATFTEITELAKTLHHTQATRILHSLGGNPNLSADGLRYVVSALSRYPSEKNCPKCAELLAAAVRLEGNPNLLITTPWQEVKDPAQRRVIAALLKTDGGSTYPTLIKAATPYENPDGAGAINLANLDLADYAIRLNEATRANPSAAPYELLTYEIFEARVYPLMQPLGLQGWDLFFRLSGEWTSSVASLLDTVTSLSK